MEIKGLATAVIFWLILNNFLPWLRLLIMTLTTHNNADALCTDCLCVLYTAQFLIVRQLASPPHHSLHTGAAVHLYFSYLLHVCPYVDLSM